MKPKLLRILGCVTDTPEGTGSASNVPTSTRNSQSTVTPQTASSASSSASSSSSKGSSNTAAIAGGVVGGVVGAVLIAGIVAWFTIRRRRAREPPSTAYMGQAAVPYPLTIETPRLYVRMFPPGHVGRTDRIFALSRTLQTRVRTPHKHHPRRSTRRTTPASSLALTPICKLTDRHISAYPRSDRSGLHPPHSISSFEN